MKNSKSKKESTAFIPEDAGMNYTNIDSPPPRTQYEKRQAKFKKEAVKDLTKGKYGRDK